MVGTWLHNGVSGVAVRNRESIGIGAAEGSQFLSLARPPQSPALTAIGGDEGLELGELGDLIEIRMSIRVDSGVPSIYPRSRHDDGTISDSGQVTLFPDGRLRIWNPTDPLYLAASHNVGLWNSLVIRFENGSDELSVSVNNSPFERSWSVSSADQGSGGSLIGFRIQPDGPGAFQVDGFAPHQLAPESALAAEEVQQGYLVLENRQRELVLFAENFESPGRDAFSADRPALIGNWSHNGLPGIDRLNMASSLVTPAEGAGFIKVERLTGGPSLTAHGEAFAVGQSQPDDLIELRFSFYNDSHEGVASIYPTQVSGADSAQISFFLGMDPGEVRIYGGTETGWNILDGQEIIRNSWNQVVIRTENGSGLWSLSVNGKPFSEPLRSVSSADNGTGGLIRGFRWQTDSDGTSYFVDSYQPTSVGSDLPVPLVFSTLGVPVGDAGVRLESGGVRVIGDGLVALDELGDVLSFFHQSEPVSRNFDVSVNLREVVSSDPDGRGGIMVRSGVGPGADVSQSLKLIAFNPEGKNTIAVAARVEDGTPYTVHAVADDSVSQLLPDLWLRMKREGNLFFLFYQSGSQSWISIGEPIRLEFSSELFLGVYAGGGSESNRDSSSGSSALFSLYGPTAGGQTIVDRPRIRYSRSDAGLVISWSNGNHILQTSENPAVSESWRNFSVEGVDEAIVPTVLPHQFFRLVVGE